MKVTKMILVGCKRLQLRNIQYFEYTPEMPNQLIIGTNGSGKSSVLNELSPLPGDPNDYLPTGSKTNYIEHKDVQYILKSTFEPKPFHSFYVVDTKEELNPGGTIMVFLDLVKQHFNYSRPIHAIVQGKKLFTDMETAERKNLFTLLCNTNYDYALGLYKRVKDKARDISGAIKLAKKRLVVETSKIMAPEAIASLKTEVAILHEALNELLERREPQRQTMGALESHAQHSEAEMRTMAYALVSLIKRINTNASLTDLSGSLEDASSSIKAFSILSTQFYQQHEEISKIYESLKLTHTQNIATIETEIGELEKQQKDIETLFKLTFRFNENVEYVENCLNSAKERLVSIIEALPSNADKQYSRASMQEATSQFESASTMVVHFSALLHQKTGLLNHFATLKLNSDPTTCPNCEHTWIKDYDQAKVDYLSKEVSEITTNLETAQRNVNTWRVKMDEIREYFQHYKDYTSLVMNWPVLNPLWDFIEEKQYIFTNPRHIETVATMLQEDLQVVKQNQRLQEQINQKLSLVQKTTENAGLDFDTAATQKQTLEDRIFENQNKLAQANRDKTYYTQQIAYINEVFEMKTKLQSYLKDYDGLSVEMTATIRRDHYNSFIAHLQSLLASKNTALTQINSQQKILDDIGRQLRLMEFEEQNLKLIMQELSPTEGMIAEGLFGFMKVFINQLNQVIKKIWTYQLKVLPCTLGDDNQVDLNYKFPMLVDNQATPRRDVNEGSDAMIEMVNLAFRITAMKSLKLADYPLYLDEFGKAMDDTHKQATIHLINTIMQDDSFSQLFMISHDVLQYGSLVHTQICVLCDANVVIPKNAVYNKHVIIR